MPSVRLSRKLELFRKQSRLPTSLTGALFRHYKDLLHFDPAHPKGAIKITQPYRLCIQMRTPKRTTRNASVNVKCLSNNNL